MYNRSTSCPITIHNNSLALGLTNAIFLVNKNNYDTVKISITEQNRRSILLEVKLTLKLGR